MSSYRIFQSSSLGAFLDSYSHLLLPSSLFGASLCLVVQNKSMGEWLKLKLAEKRGICAGSEAILPEKAMRDLAQGYACVRKLRSFQEEGEEGVLPVFYLDNLKIRIYKILEGFMAPGVEVPASCRELLAYVQGFHAEDEFSKRKIRSGRLYDLADSIAGLLAHYGMNCSDMIACWDRGQAFPGIPRGMKKHEEWQRYFWKLAYDGGLPLSAILKAAEESDEPWEGEESPIGNVKRVVLFGSSFLGDRALRFFQRLSRDVPVDHFILTPSEYYNMGKLDLSAPKNPLLESWCTQMDGFASIAAEEMTGNASGAAGGCQFQDAGFSIPSGKNLLEILQQDLLKNRIFDIESGSLPEEESPRQEILERDSSLEIHGFPGPWRETEVLRDLIHNALNRDAGLKLTDIAVLAPDINVYAPYLEALFPSDDARLHLPFNIIDLDSGGDSPLNQGFLHLLSMPGGRFTRRELFTLFDNPCFAERFNLSRRDRENWLNLCLELNIKWGYDGEHKKRFFPEASDFNTWDRAFQRIKEGLFFEEGDKPDILPFPASDEESGRSRGMLMHITESLFHDLYGLDRMKMTLEQWVFLTESLLETYFQARENHSRDERDLMDLKGCFRDILNMAAETPLPHPHLSGFRDFDWISFRSILTEYIQKTSGRRGRYLTQGITCSSLKPMRAIPFRRIYILGMNEGAFPREDTALSFDLRPFNEQKIDLSRRGGDLYAFLETFLSTGEHLCLSYQSRDAQRGEELQPSSVIAELLDYVDARFSFSGGRSARDVLFREEKIHGFLPSAFDDSGLYPSFDSAAYESARIYQEHEKFPHRSVSSPPLKLIWKDSPEEGHSAKASEKGESHEENEPEDLSLWAMLSCLKNPVAWYFRKVLGIYPEEEESPELDSLENINLDFLDRYRYLEQSLNKPSELGEDLECFLAEQTRRGSLTDGDLSFFDRDALEYQLDGMAEQFAFLELERRTFLNLDIGSTYILRRPSSDLQNLSYPAILREIRNEENLFKVSLSGELRRLSFDDNTGEVLKLEYSASKSPGIRQDLEALLVFLFLTVLDGLPSECRSLKLVRVGTQAHSPRIFSPKIFGDKSPGEVLDRLVSFCLQPGEVLPLYPLLGEALAGLLRKKPSMDNDELLKRWGECWEKEASNDWGAAPFHSCYYRQRYLPCAPHVNVDALRELLELIYIPLAGGYLDD